MTTKNEQEELNAYIRDYIKYCNKYRDADRYYPKSRKPKVESYFRSLDEFHPEERAHHYIERKYWKYSFRISAVIGCGSLVTVGLSLWAVIISKQSAGDAHNAMIAAQTQAAIAQTSYEASSRGTIVTYGVDWVQTAAKDQEGYIQIKFGNTGKNTVTVKVIPQYDYGNPTKKFGFGAVEIGKSFDCRDTQLTQNEGISVAPLSTSS